jgi:glutamate dehydrogenase (NADP+)
MNFIQKTLDKLKISNCPSDSNFFQAVKEVLESIEPIIKQNPKYEKYSIVDQLIVPNKQIQFKVCWFDDNNKVQVNNGYRIQFNNALGPYKGGLRFHPSVNSDILKFLAFEQIFKNSLTTLSIGGAKGGSDFNPKGKSDAEIMRFCQAFMLELHKHIGARIDVPAGDIGVGSREIGYLYGAYKKLTSSYEGVLTGKPDFLGGSNLRPQATGYGVVYFTKKLLELTGNDTLEGKTCTVSGSGNVAIYTIEKLSQLGATVVTCSDSRGSIYDKRGLDIELLKKIKFENRDSLEEYAKIYPSVDYIKIEEYEENSHFVWSIPSYVAIPCATQNEVTLNDAKNLASNKTTMYIEGANMPSCEDAMEFLQKSDVIFAPAKAANAGGVAVSEFEMAQNASMQKYSSSKVDGMLKDTMEKICTNMYETAKEYGVEGNYVDGANIAGFKKVADAMIAQGI